MEEKVVAKKPLVTIEMEDGGIIKIELYPSKAPETVNNFVSLINKGFYDGFHDGEPDWVTVIFDRLLKRW